VSRVAETIISGPTLNWGWLLPVTITLTAAIVAILVEAFVPRNSRRPIQLVLFFAALVGAGAVLVVDWTQLGFTATGSVAHDGPAVLLQAIILLVSLIVGFIVAERNVDGSGDAFAPAASTVPGSDDEREATRVGWTQTEIWPLMLFSIGGAMLFVAASDFLTLFVALEVMSLPLYLMAGLARRRRLLSQEAALKYFLLGAFASAVLLFGIALAYAYSGTLYYNLFADAVASTTTGQGILLVSIGLISVGMLFKIGAVPFHQWVPDVYQGSPTPVTTFMASVVKIAAFGALLRIFYVAFLGLQWEWRPVIWTVAILTMLVGVVVAITQTDVKRMLAYSSIANTGYILVGFAGVSGSSVAFVIFYLLVYGIATAGAFAIVMLVRDPGGEATHLSRWTGLGKTNPLIAGIFSLFLLSFAGIPLTAGFIAKFGVFAAAIDGGALPLVIVGVFSSVIAAFFYVRVIVLMFFSDPLPDGPRVAYPSVLTSVAIGLTAIATVLLGVFPQAVLDLIHNAGVFLR
jgi:NADH-quinone oxidoreductase subunit N